MENDLCICVGMGGGESADRKRVEARIGIAVLQWNPFPFGLPDFVFQ